MKLSFGGYLCFVFITLICITDILSENSEERLNQAPLLYKSGASDATVNAIYTINPGYSQPFSYRKWFVGWVFYLLGKAMMLYLFVAVVLFFLILFGSMVGICFPKLGFNISAVAVLILMQMVYTVGSFIGFPV